MIREVEREGSVSSETMIPDLLSRHPQVRPVLNRYGLNGCGGKLGPVESVGFFARTHGVDEARLLSEVGAAIARGLEAGTAADACESTVADAIYRRYFTAGIAIVLTAGATWGAWLLWQIGIKGAFTAISIFQVNAHGHAQIFGWVGLFIMGFAYQAFPRIWHTPLAAPRLAAAAFLSMLVGMIVQVTGMTLAGHWALATPAAVLGNILQIAAVITFAGQLAVTYRRSGKPFEPYVGFAFAATGWFIAMSVFSLWHTYQTMSATTREQLLWYVATYQAPLRDVQIHGLALFMILGVCLRMLPALFDLPQVAPRRAWTALGLLTVAVLAESVLFIVYRWTHQHAWAGAMWLSWIMLAAGAGLVVWPWKLWRPVPSSESQFDRSAKFIRTAYAWLAISLLMLLALPLYQVVSGIPFSHAYYGAIRHAITVGFVSLMIMGFAAKVVPTLNGIDTRTLTPLWGPFILVNLGCLLRVSTQTLTDWHPAFFAVIGVSGTLEVAGLAWWGVGLIRIIRAGKREAASTQSLPPRPDRIEAGHRVADVIAWFPQTEPVFVGHGFTAIQHAVFRRTLARQVSLAQACRMHNIDAAQFLADLNAAVSSRPLAAPEFVPLNIAVSAR